MMLRLLPLLLAGWLLPAAMNAQKNPPAYALFNQKGKATSYKKLIKAARESDVILFGESHNDPIGHWLQNLLASDLATDGGLTIGMEMFESDQQAALAAYLAGETEVTAIDEVGEGLWNNFRTDYQPLVDWAKANGQPVVATNVPRKYARMVYKEGFTALAELPAAEKALLPPLPVPYDAELPGYKAMLDMMPAGHGGETFPMAQAIKDASMAHFIVTNKQAGRRFLHLNGSYHSDNFEGIGWYLNKYAPELRVLTITTVEEAEATTLSDENSGKAHFTVVVPKLMTKTY